eukprot:49842_1
MGARGFTPSIMKQTIYEKFKIIQTKTFSQKLAQYINLNEVTDNLNEITIETNTTNDNYELEIKQDKTGQCIIKDDDMHKYKRMKDSGIRLDVIHKQIKLDYDTDEQS